ncbi:MAG TPA: DUF883 C-terminal domain-containing protein [Pirellulales bacterium]|nr:DUF883 C-terminal domain-containing protein [Pirellulales bacterium]
MSDAAESVPGSGPAHGKAQETMEHFAHAASECCSAWSEQLRDCTNSAEDFVRKQPIKSLLIAAGVGLLIGLVVRR